MTSMTRSPTPERAFSLLRANARPPKLRTRGVSEIRGPYYAVVGPRYLGDVLETMGEHVDALKSFSGSFASRAQGTKRLWGRVVTYPGE